MVNKSSNIKERILQISDYKGITRELFFKKIGMTYGNFKGKSKETPINSNSLVDILTNFPDIDPEWLILGSGQMIKRSGIYKEKSASGDFAGVMYGGKLEPVNPQPSKETETDMSEKEIIEMQKGYIDALKFKVDALTRENQALAEQIKSWRTQEDAIKNM